MYRLLKKGADGAHRTYEVTKTFWCSILWRYWTYFQYMGLIWKVVIWSLICRHFVVLSLSDTEKLIDEVGESRALLFTAGRCSVNKSGGGPACSSMDYAVTERLSSTNCRQIKDQTTTIQMSPTYWKSVQYHQRLGYPNFIVTSCVRCALYAPFFE